MSGDRTTTRDLRRLCVGAGVALAVLAAWLALATAPAMAQQLLTKWGSQGTSDGQFQSPFAIAADAEGNVYVADTFNHRIQKFAPNGALLTKFGSFGTGDGQFNEPSGIDVGPNGNLYVADFQNDRVQVLTPSGAFVAKFGSPGTGDGQFSQPFGLAFSPAGHLYVSEFQNFRIQQFTPAGTFVSKFGSFGSGDGQFNAPAGLAFGPGGNLYVADSNNHRVQVLTPGGAFISKFGTLGAGDGQFASPTDVAVDPAGDLYVVDANNGRVQRFTASGSFLSKFGSPGPSDGQFTTPIAIAVDCRSNLYVADLNSHRVQKFGTPGATDPPCLATAALETPPALAAQAPGDRDADTVPDATDNCADVPNTDQADRDRDRIGDACDVSDASPGPAVGETVVGRLVSGDVFVRRPQGGSPYPRDRGARAPTARGAQAPAGFVPLQGAGLLPVGTIVHSVRGRLSLTAVQSATRTGRRERTQTADFYAGIFQIKQARARRPVTELTLRSTDFASVCGRSARGSTAAAAQRRSRVVSRLWGNGRGRFRTAGRHSSATVRGTIWLTQERCEGTLTQVRRGSVSVRDRTARRTVTVRAGGSYLARARRASVRNR